MRKAEASERVTAKSNYTKWTTCRHWNSDSTVPVARGHRGPESMALFFEDFARSILVSE